MVKIFSDQPIDNVFFKVLNLVLFVKSLLRIHCRISAEIDQFTSGMNEVGQFWEIIRDNHEVFKPLFCHSPKQLTKNVIDSLCTYCYSDQGSNRRAVEEQTVYAWELFLEAIEGIDLIYSYLTLFDLLVLGQTLSR